MEPAWFESVSRRAVRKTAAVAVSRQALAAECTATLVRSREALLDLQKPEGFWCGDLLADTTLESDYILLQLWLHPPGDGGWNPPSWHRVRKAAQSILRRQLPDGGFNIYPGGPADVSASVKAQQNAPLPDDASKSEVEATNLDQVIVTGVRTPKAVDKIPGAITLVSKEDIAHTLLVTEDATAVLARTVPGYAESSQAMSNTGEPLRGRIALRLFDGVPQGSPLREGGRNATFTDMGMVGRIEVINGPPGTIKGLPCCRNRTGSHVCRINSGRGPGSNARQGRQAKLFGCL